MARLSLVFFLRFMRVMLRHPRLRSTSVTFKLAISEIHAIVVDYGFVSEVIFPLTLCGVACFTILLLSNLIIPAHLLRNHVAEVIQRGDSCSAFH